MHYRLKSWALVLSLGLTLMVPLSAREDPDRRQKDRAEPAERPARKESEDDRKESGLVKRELQAEVSLCDGRSLKGKVLIELPDAILFTHSVDGLEFVKKVRIADIKSFEYERWTPAEQDRRKDGKVFRFDVTRFRVELNDSTELQVQRPLPPYLSRLKFSNRNGEVLLYSFWMDLLKGDNSWYTGIQGPPDGERAFCHKDVVKKLVFTR